MNFYKFYKFWEFQVFENYKDNIKKKVKIKYN